MKIFVCLFLGTLLLAGCDVARKRADLVFINGAEPESLDPAIIVGQPEGRLVNALFEGLTTYDELGKPQPGVASSWEISEDKLTYTFHLRPEAVWSNGRPVVAGDFVASWRRTLSPETASGYSYQLYYLRSAKDFAEGKVADFTQVGARALDDHTLQVTLENPTPFFLSLCATPPLYAVPPEVVAKYGDDWIKPGKIAGNGAYLLTSWRINDKIRLKKNPGYWNAKSVALDTIDVLPISKETVAYNFYSSGLADLLMDKGLAPPPLLNDLRVREDFHSAPFLGTYFLRFNCSKPPFSDPRVRRAFSLAVDKEILTKKITRAGELPATSFVPLGIEGYVSPEVPRRNPEEARALLAAAGYPGGKGFPRVTYLYSEGGLNEAIAVEIQHSWEQELGIRVDLARQEWKVYLNSLSSLDYGIARSSWVGDYPDPNTFLDMFVTGGGNNRTGWSSKGYDALIDAAAKEPDAAKRFAILRQAEALLIESEMPVCPLYFYVGIQIYDPKCLGGIAPNVLDEHPLKAMYRKDR